MKKLELLGLSVITAALIVSTGCSSDDDDGDSKPSAPAEISKGVELNTSVTRNAMALLGTSMDDMPDLSAARLTPKLSILKVAKSSDSENTTGNFPCEVSGSVTVTRTSTSTGDEESYPEKSWSNEEQTTYTLNDCVDNYSGVNFAGDALNEVLMIGTVQFSEYEGYNSDTNRSKSSSSLSDHYSAIFQSSSTKATITEIIDYNESDEMEFDGPSNSVDINATTEYRVNGTYERYHTDTNGARIAGIGERGVYGDYVSSAERIVTSAKKSTATLYQNGFFSEYETNSTGEHVVYGKYFNNYRVETVKVGDESNITMSGTVGGKCLGGSVTVAVNPVIQENPILYPDLGPNDPALPYAGKATLTGSNTATVTFSVNSSDKTKTRATVQVDDGLSIPFENWSSLAKGECQDD